MQACPMVLAIWGCPYAMTVALMGQSELNGLERAISLLVAAFWSGHLQLALPASASGCFWLSGTFLVLC